jgi:transcriptional regulator with XRE-family HTH domain
MQGRLQAARKARGWSQARLIHELQRRAADARVPVMTPGSLRTAVSRWENGRVTPDAVYRRLLRETFGLSDAELGFRPETPPAAAVPTAADELRARLASTTSVDAELVRLVRDQTDTVRRLDRRLGAPVLLEQMRAHIATLRDLLTHAVLDSTRRPLAAVLADASALAGWQALDVGAVSQAWEHYELAKAAARESGDPALLAHAKGEQSYALLDLDRPADAVALLREARVEGGRKLPALLTSWLLAAEAEASAAAGDQQSCRRALQAADDALPSDTADPDLPFISLNACHLSRWRGHTLARLGDGTAIEHLQTALAGIDAEFTRARGSLHIDLAHALTVGGDRDEAAVHVAAANELAARTGSVRQRRRLAQLVA